MATDNIRNLSNVNFQDVPSTAELPALLGTAKDVYISIRTDGESGSGTQLDPLDGSTAAKFDAIFLSYAAVTYVHFHLGPGTFQTNCSNRTWQFQHGWWLQGSGMGVTTIQAIVGTATFPNLSALGISDYSAPVVNGVIISDMTVDANGTTVSASYPLVGGERNCTVGIIQLPGNNNLVERVIGLHQYGSFGNLAESFGIRMYCPNGVSVSGNIIRQCVVKEPVGTYATPYEFGGSFDNVFPITDSQLYDSRAEGINDGLGYVNAAGVYSAAGTTPVKSGGLNLAAVRRIQMSNNVFIDCESIVHHDTGMAEDVVVVNNELVRGYYGVSSLNATRWKVTGNQIQLQLRNGNQANYGIVFIDTGTDVEIQNNTITTTSGGLGTDTFVPIYITSIDKPRLINNTVPNYACTFAGNANATLFGNKHPDGSTVANLLDNVPTYVNLNTGTPTAGAAGTLFQYAGANTVSPVGLLDGFGASPSFIGRRAEGTAASKTTVVAGNLLAVFGGRGYDGTAYVGSARGLMRITSAETWTTIAHGTYVDLQTTPLGSITPASIVRLQPSGGASFGTQAIALADPGNGVVLAGKAARIIAVTFANAVSSPAEGTIQPFTDSSTASIGGVITGGGANHVIGYYNGTNWVVIGGSGVGTSATIQTTLKILKGDNAGNAIEATENGTGPVVLTSNATLIAPTLGVATATSFNKLTINAPTTAASFTFGADNCDYAFPGQDCNIGFREIPQNSQSAAYTLVLTDNGKEIHHPASDNIARAFTIPANASVAFPIGTVVLFTNLAATSCTVPITTDTMTLLGAGTTGTRTIAQYGQLVARKVATTAWVCNGVGVS